MTRKGDATIGGEAVPQVFSGIIAQLKESE
jgi:hypothetical protein